MILSNANRRFTVVRQIAELLNSDASASMSLTYSVSRESLLQVRVYGGTANTGTMTFDGVIVTSPGTTTTGTETLTWTEAGYQTTSKRFTSVSGVTSSGLATEATVPTVVVKATGADGSVQHTAASIKTGYPGFLDTNSPTYRGETASLTNEENLRLLVQYDETWTPRVGDIFVDDDDGAQYFLRGSPFRMGNVRPKFWECRVSRRDRSTSV